MIIFASLRRTDLCLEGKVSFFFGCCFGSYVGYWM